MAARGSGARKSYRRIVLERFLVAFVFGNIIAWLATQPMIVRIPVVSVVKQQGAAIAVSLATLWNDMLAPGGVPLPSGTSQVSIVDIDEPACEAIVGHTRCHFDRIGYPEVLDAALAAADRSGAKAIVFDIVLPTREEALASEAGKRLSKRLEMPGPPVVAAIPFSHDRYGNPGINWADSICGRPRCGRLQLAPAFAHDSLGGARAYAGMVTVASIASLGAGEEHSLRIPSLALAAVRTFSPAIDAPGTFPVLYTFPSFMTLTARRDKLLLNARMGKYMDSVTYGRIQVAQAGAGKAPEFAVSVPQGAVVLIGTSAPVMDDWHETPLGTMAGVEVVANAIRTLELREQGKASRHASSIWRWLLTVLTWAVLVATVAAIVWVEQRRATMQRRLRRAHRPIWIIDRYTPLTLAILAVALVVELWLKVAEVVSELAAPGARTGDLDIIFPLLAIFFTTAIEVSQRFLRKLEWGAGTAIEGAERLYDRVRTSDAETDTASDV